MHDKEEVNRKKQQAEALKRRHHVSSVGISKKIHGERQKTENRCENDFKAEPWGERETPESNKKQKKTPPLWFSLAWFEHANEKIKRFMISRRVVHRRVQPNAAGLDSQAEEEEYPQTGSWLTGFQHLFNGGRGAEGWRRSAAGMISFVLPNLKSGLSSLGEKK